MSAQHLGGSSALSPCVGSGSLAALSAAQPFYLALNRPASTRSFSKPCIREVPAPSRTESALDWARSRLYSRRSCPSSSSRGCTSRRAISSRFARSTALVHRSSWSQDRATSTQHSLSPKSSVRRASQNDCGWSAAPATKTFFPSTRQDTILRSSDSFLNTCGAMQRAKSAGPEAEASDPCSPASSCRQARGKTSVFTFSKPGFEEYLRDTSAPEGQVMPPTSPEALEGSVGEVTLPPNFCFEALSA